MKQSRGGQTVHNVFPIECVLYRMCSLSLSLSLSRERERERENVCVCVRARAFACVRDVTQYPVPLGH